MSKFKITTAFEDYNTILEKAMITIDTGIYFTLKPFEESSIVDGKTVIIKKIEVVYSDETSGYRKEWIMDRKHLKQLVTLFQTLQGQLSIVSTDNDTTSGCSRVIMK